MVYKDDAIAFIDTNFQPIIDGTWNAIQVVTILFIGIAFGPMVLVTSFTGNGYWLKVSLWTPAYLALYEMVNTPMLALLYPYVLFKILYEGYSY